MVTRSSLVGQADQRLQIRIRGESAYQCDVCERRVRVPSDKFGIDVVQRCIITKNCLGKLHLIKITAEANSVPAIPPSIPNVKDWFQRRIFSLHEQAIANSIWLVEHNLTANVTVQAFIEQVEDGEEILVEVDPEDVRVIDLNTIEIEFDRPQKGIVHCLAYASENTVNPSVGSPTVITQPTLLLTNNGELTIATMDSTPLITFTVRYNSVNVPEGFVDVEYVGVDDQPSILSPWVGANKVFVNGRDYTVRSFNIVTQPLAASVFGNGLVANGTQFNFTTFGTTPNQNLILLGTPPFTVVDRIVDRFVDIALINPIQPELAYASGEAFAAPSVIKTTYPLINVVD